MTFEVLFLLTGVASLATGTTFRKLRRGPLKSLGPWLIVAGILVIVGVFGYGASQYNWSTVIAVSGLGILALGIFFYWAAFEDWLTHVGIGLAIIGIILMVGACILTLNHGVFVR